MEIQEFIDKIKDRLGDELPSDLIFNYKNGRLFFYNKDTPDKSTILEFSQVVDFKLNLDHCVEIIKHYHSPKMWMETFNPNDPKHDLSKGIYNAMVESANKKKHVGKELTESEVHENRSSKYEFLDFGKEDINHLEWIFDRMVEVHSENPNYDYMIRFRKIIETFKKK